MASIPIGKISAIKFENKKRNSRQKTETNLGKKLLKVIGGYLK